MLPTWDFLSCYVSIIPQLVLNSRCRFLALPHPGLALYRHCIDLETNLASIGDKSGLVNARKLYESALATYDQNVSLWQDYYRMETKVKFFFFLFSLSDITTAETDKMSLIGLLFIFKFFVGFGLYICVADSLSFNSNDASHDSSFLGFIMQMGTSEKASAIYWRARKVLKDASEFIASPDM